MTVTFHLGDKVARWDSPTRIGILTTNPYTNNDAAMQRVAYDDGTGIEHFVHRDDLIPKGDK